MNDARLSEELAQTYELGSLVDFTRGPHRIGRPGLLTLTAASGRRVVVKEHNGERHLFNSSVQRDAAFHERCYRLGLPAPAPVLTREGFHGGVFDRDGSENGYDYRSFTAAEFVDGLPVLAAQLDRRQLRRALECVGAAGAILRVASQGIGPWDLYANATPDMWSMKVEWARRLGAEWVDTLEAALPLLIEAGDNLALGHDFRFVAPAEMQPKDTMVLSDGTLRFVDFEHLQVVRHDEILPWATDHWTAYAESQGMSAEEASSTMTRAYQRTLSTRRFCERETLPADSPLGSAYVALYKDVTQCLALLEHRNRVSVLWAADLSAEMPGKLERLADEHAAVAPQLTNSRGSSLGLTGSRTNCQEGLSR